MILDTARSGPRALAAIALLLTACSTTFPTPSLLSLDPSTTAPSASGLAPTAAASTQIEAPTAVALPNPGGTCVASQFAVGPSTSYYTFSTIVSRHVIVLQPLTNTGAECVMALPTVLGLAASGGPYVAVPVGNVGTQTCKGGACKFIYPTSFRIQAGQSVRVMFNASWWEGYSPELGTPPPPPPCEGPISDVSRADFPLASGTIEIDWDTVLREVCTSPTSLSLTVEYP